MNLIVARGINGEIGANNELLWKLPGDMKHFKETTRLNTVIMGRKTWESIGGKPLPIRHNIVITSNPSKMQEKYGEPKSTVFTTLEGLTKRIDAGFFTIGIQKKFFGELFVIGGAEIYKQLDRYTNVMYITEVEQTFPEADTFFRGLSGEWDIEKLQSAEENGLKYSIYKHTRRD